MLHGLFIGQVAGFETASKEPDNYLLSEMSGSALVTTNTLYSHTNEQEVVFGGQVYMFGGVYTNTTDLGCTDSGHTLRLLVLGTARYFAGRPDLGYCALNAIKKGAYTYWYWNGTLKDILALRCDGLVEACYEMNGVMAWGRKNPNGQYGHDIRYWDSANHYYNLMIHNTWEIGDKPWDGNGSFYAWMAPITQCGYADTYVRSKHTYSSGAFNFSANTFRGTFWETTFHPQRMVYPIGLAPDPAR